MQHGQVRPLLLLLLLLAASTGAVQLAVDLLSSLD
jgi:hypothetical protein